MASFLESVSDSASGRTKEEGKKKREKDKGKGMNFGERLANLLGKKSGK